MELTAVSVQTITANNNVIFTNTPIKGNCSIIHRDGSGLIKLRGLSNTQSRSRFRVSFGGNIAVPSGGTIGAISLAISVDGEPLSSAMMTVTPAAVEEYFNIYSDVYVDVPTGCCAVVSIVNTSTQTIELKNANLIVERVA